MDGNQRIWDLSVPSVRDVEAPLGGTSTVYEIVLLQGEEKFLYTKTFREIEDFSRKLHKKFSSVKFPILTTSSDVELKRNAAEGFLKFIAENPAIVSSNLTQQFIGQDKSIKQVVSDRNQNPPLPVTSTVDNDLFEDLHKNSRFSPLQESNLFDDDSCDLFSTEAAAENSRKNETKVTEQRSKDEKDSSIDQKPSESEGEDDDHLFLPRKGTLVQTDELIGETDDIFRLEDDNLSDLYRAVSERRRSTSNDDTPTVAKSRDEADGRASKAAPLRNTSLAARVLAPEAQKVALVKPQHLFSSVPKDVEAEQNYSPPARKIPQFQLESEDSQGTTVHPVKPSKAKPLSQVKPVSHFISEVKPVPDTVSHVKPVPDSVPRVKPVPPVKPVLPVKPNLPGKPAPPPKPTTMPKPVSSEQKPSPPETVPVLDPVDIGSYIAAAEMDNQREISLFDE